MPMEQVQVRFTQQERERLLELARKNYRSLSQECRMRVLLSMEEAKDTAA